jgi:hypothetical protein
MEGFAARQTYVYLLGKQPHRGGSNIPSSQYHHTLSMLIHFFYRRLLYAHLHIGRPGDTSMDQLSTY